MYLSTWSTVLDPNPDRSINDQIVVGLYVNPQYIRSGSGLEPLTLSSIV